MRPVSYARASDVTGAVAAVSADPVLFHGLNVTVREREPVAVVRRPDGAETAVSGDGYLLPAEPTHDLPAIESPASTGAARLSGGAAAQARILGAAPDPLAPLIDFARQGDAGIEIVLRGGIVLRFGDGTRAAKKWAGAASVLADPQVSAASLVDLRVPARPALSGAGTLPSSPETAP